jgi:cytochrome c peroxidase
MSALAIGLLICLPPLAGAGPPASRPTSAAVASVRGAAPGPALEASVREAARAGARLIVLPEYALAGGGAQAESIPGPATARLAGLARSLGVWIAAGLGERDGRGGFYSAAVLAGPDGALELHQRKVIVRSGREDGAAHRGDFRAARDAVDAGGLRVGIMSGDDARIGIARLAERGVDIVLAPALWPDDEWAEWSALCRQYAAEFGVTIAAATPHAAAIFLPGKAPLEATGRVVTATAPVAARRWAPVSALGLPPTIPAPYFEPASQELADLGRRLFFDPKLSSTGAVACASCHQPDKAYTDGRRKGVGVHNRETKRNVPSLLNVAFRPVLQWDGYATSIENFTKYPISNVSEMDFHYLDAVPRYVNSQPGYVAGFRAALGVEKVEFPHVAKALATFERTLISGGSRFDRYQYAGEHNALDAAERRGLALFRGKAGCARCHAIGERYALFLDFKFHVLGVGYSAETGRFEDIGLAGVSTDDQKGLFQTPSLRDVARTAPYMHDGSLATLADVIEFYDRGGVPNPQLDPLIRPLGLSPSEKRDLAAFLHSLDGAPAARPATAVAARSRR